RSWPLAPWRGGASWRRGVRARRCWSRRRRARTSKGSPRTPRGRSGSSWGTWEAASPGSGSTRPSGGSATARRSWPCTRTASGIQARAGRCSTPAPSWPRSSTPPARPPSWSGSRRRPSSPWPSRTSVAPPGTCWWWETTWRRIMPAAPPPAAARRSCSPARPKAALSSAAGRRRTWSWIRWPIFWPDDRDGGQDRLLAIGPSGLAHHGHGVAEGVGVLGEDIEGEQHVDEAELALRQVRQVSGAHGVEAGREVVAGAGGAADRLEAGFRRVAGQRHAIGHARQRHADVLRAVESLRQGGVLHQVEGDG